MTALGIPCLMLVQPESCWEYVVSDIFTLNIVVRNFSLYRSTISKMSPARSSHHFPNTASHLDSRGSRAVLLAALSSCSIQSEW